MRILMKTKLLPLIALAIIAGAILLSGTMAAYAAEDPPADAQILSVDEVWLTGDTLHVTVTDLFGENRTLELNLSDYAMPGDEYVTIQATDSGGSASNFIQFRNPYYVPQAYDPTGSTGIAAVAEPSGDAGEPAEQPNINPFTPGGTGSVLDNATDGDGKEFFTVETPEGNIFYLIVDRQRTTENVYLLNAVTESDLMALAEPGDGTTANQAQPIVTPTPPAPTETETEPPTPPAPEKSGGNTGTIAIVIIAVVAVGGAGYYFKIVRPKQQGAGGYDDYDEQEEDEEEGVDEYEELDVIGGGEGDDEE